MPHACWSLKTRADFNGGGAIEPIDALQFR
jgi:hypothetical protein